MEQEIKKYWEANAQAINVGTSVNYLQSRIDRAKDSLMKAVAKGLVPIKMPNGRWILMEVEKMKKDGYFKTIYECEHIVGFETLIDAIEQAEKSLKEK